MTTLALALALACLPRIAAACPYCMSRNDGSTFRIVCVLLLVPFAVAGAVLRVIRRIAREDAERPDPSRV